jgi:hypothetical protein
MSKALPCAVRRAVLLAAGCIASALVTAPVMAQQTGDQWEVTVKMEMAGMPMNMPAHTTRVCMPKHARDESFVPHDSGDCRVTDSKRSGNTVRYRMECSGKEAMVAEGEFTFAGDSYHGTMHMTGKSGEGFDMTQSYSGRKTGECSNPMH